jgi:hypothetical protein
MHLILTGATGLVGSAVLNFVQQQAIPSGQVDKLTILTRRPVPIVDTRNDKIQIITHSNFSSYPPELLSQLQGADGCVWSIGISQNVVQEEEYTNITVSYALEAAKAFAGLSPKFNFVYVSSDNATQDPGMLTLRMARIKGRAKTELLALPTSKSEHASLHIFSVRPGGVDPRGDDNVLDVFRNHRTRGYSPMVEKVLVPVFRAMYPAGVSPTTGLGRLLTEIASGNGEPLQGDDLRADGRIVPNKAILRIIGGYEKTQNDHGS